MKNISIPSGALNLEARYQPAATNSPAAVICHPHPEFGGSMENNVVYALEAELSAAGCSTLAFNFRGVGESGGRYDDMVGEIDDVIAAWEWLANQPEVDPGRMTLCGYSFGGYMALRAASRLIEVKHAEELAPPIQSPAALRLVSPMPGPPGWEDEVRILWQDPPTTKIITGEHDDICATDFARALAARLQADLTIIKNGDHFYAGRERDIAKWVL